MFPSKEELRCVKYVSMFCISWPNYNQNQVKVVMFFLQIATTIVKRQRKLCFPTPVFVYNTECTVLHPSHLQTRGERPGGGEGRLPFEKDGGARRKF